MGERIIIGVLSGLVLATTAGIWNSVNFSKGQKTFLTICIIFPPAQWLLAIIIYVFNKKNDILIDYNQNINFKDLEKLKQLKNSKILSNDEYEIKANKIKNKSILNEIKKTGEYKTLYQLNKKGILTDNEFDEKIKLLLGKQNSDKINTESKPVNDLPITLKDVIIPDKLKEELRINTNTLVFLLLNPNRYIKYFKNEEFPFFCALVLDSRNYKLTDEHLEILNDVAKDYFNMQGYKEKFNNMKINKYSR